MPGIVPHAQQVAILMALHNGAAHLAEQLASFAAQDHADWVLIASDDGSRDGGPALVRGWLAATGRDGRVIDGPEAGFAANFLHLLGAAGPDVPYAALSDQDDVWLPARLARGVAALGALPAGVPGLWCCRSLVSGPNLEPLGFTAPVPLPPSFGNALVHNIAAGHAILLNRAALDLVQATLPAVAGLPLPAHDWWLYLLVTGAGGRVLSDPEPLVLYRQHHANAIGAQGRLRDRARRARELLFGGELAARNAAHVAALERVAEHLTPENRRRLAAFARLRGAGGPVRRLRAAREAGLTHQGPVGRLLLAFGVAAGRV